MDVSPAMSKVGEKVLPLMEGGGPAGTQTQLGSEPFLFRAPNYSPVICLLFDSDVTNDVSR